MTQMLEDGKIAAPYLLTKTKLKHGVNEMMPSRTSIFLSVSALFVIAFIFYILLHEAIISIERSKGLSRFERVALLLDAEKVKNKVYPSHEMIYEGRHQIPILKKEISNEIKWHDNNNIIYFSDGLQYFMIGYFNMPRTITPAYI